jgi:hypothetical protein
MDALTRVSVGRRQTRPRASMPYSLSQPLFPEGSYHLSMKRISEVLFTTARFTARAVRCGVDLDCNPPLFDSTTAWLFFLLSKILSDGVSNQ